MLKRCFLCLMLLLSLGLPVHAMSVTALGNHIYLGHNDETATSGDVKFVIINHVLHLMSKDGTKDFLSFINTDGIVGSGVDYDVRDVYTSNPTMHLWEITATSGAQWGRARTEAISPTSPSEISPCSGTPRTNGTA